MQSITVADLQALQQGSTEYALFDIREAALENLPKTSENQAFIDKVRAAVQKYKDIGVRVEDSFLLTATGVENLSAGVPRTIEAIEQFLKPVGSARR